MELERQSRRKREPVDTVAAAAASSLMTLDTQYPPYTAAYLELSVDCKSLSPLSSLHAKPRLLARAMVETTRRNAEFHVWRGEKKAAERYIYIHVWIHSTHELHQQIRKKKETAIGTNPNAPIKIGGLVRQTINYLDEIVTSSEYKLPAIDRLSQRCHLLLVLYTIVISPNFDI